MLLSRADWWVTCSGVFFYFTRGPITLLSVMLCASALSQPFRCCIIFVAGSFFRFLFPTGLADVAFRCMSTEYQRI